MRGVYHRADVIDHLRDIGEALADSLIVRVDGDDSEDIGGEHSAGRGERHFGFLEEIDDGADPPSSGVVRPKVGSGEIAVGWETHVIVLNLIEDQSQPPLPMMFGCRALFERIDPGAAIRTFHHAAVVVLQLVVRSATIGSLKTNRAIV